MLKNRIIVGAFALGIGTVTACGAGDGGLPSAQSLLRDAALASKGVTSGHVSMTTSGGTVPGVAADSVEADVTHKDAASAGAKGVAQVRLGGDPTPVEFVQASGKLFIKDQREPQSPYGSAPPEQNGSALPNPSALLDPDSGMAHVISSMQRPKTVSKENVNGVEAFKVTGKVAQDALLGAMPGVQSDADMTCWIRADGMHRPVKSELRFVGAQGENPTLNLVLSEAGKPVTVQAPNAA